MKKYIIGALAGSVLTISATAGAAAVKQYILTDASYPIVVNGKEFKDPESPILNYNGSTYVPLAKLGDLTGVNYKWNDDTKRVEIGPSNNTYSTATDSVQVLVPTKDGLRDVDALLAEEDIIRKFIEQSGPTVQDNGEKESSAPKPVGLVEENGETAFYAYDLEGSFRGRYTDADNKTKPGETFLRLADGWMPFTILSEIYKGTETKNDELIIKNLSPVSTVNFKFPLPKDFVYTKNVDEFTVNGVRIKQQDYRAYIKIEDLQKAGIIK